MPCSPRCRRSTTPRSASPSPSSAWSSRSSVDDAGRVAVDDPADRLGLPDEGDADPRHDRGAADGRRASPPSTSTLGVMSDEQRASLRDAPARRHRRARDPVRQARLADPRLCRRLRQGRRRQVLGHRQPRGLAGRRAACGSASSTPTSTASRCRACSASSSRPTQVDDMILPPARARREGHLDRHVRPRQPAGRLARPDAAPGPAAVPRRRVLGRPRRAAARPAARAPATSRSRWPSSSPAPRSSSSPRRSRPPPRWPSGPARSRCRPTSASSASSRTCRWLELPDGSRQEIFGCGGGQARGRLAHPARSAPRCRCSARSRSTPGCARAATAACRSCSASPTSPAAVALRGDRPRPHDPRARPGRPLPGPHPRRSLSPDGRRRSGTSSGRSVRASGRVAAGVGGDGVGRVGRRVATGLALRRRPPRVRRRRRAAPRGRSGAGRTAAGRTAASRCRRTPGPSARAPGPWRRVGHRADLPDQPRRSLAAYSGSRSGPEDEHGDDDRGRTNSQPLMSNTSRRPLPLASAAISRSTACRVILTVRSSPPRRTVSVDAVARRTWPGSPTTNSSESVTGRPSNSRMTSPGLMPALSAGPPGVDRAAAAARRRGDPHAVAGVGAVEHDADDRVRGLAGRDQLLGRLARPGRSGSRSRRRCCRTGCRRPLPGTWAMAELTPMTSPGHVEQRAAGVAGVDRRVGLDRVDERRWSPPRRRGSPAG